MKHNILRLIALAALPYTSASAVDYPEHNFSIALPAGWTAINPPPQQVLFAVRSPDQSKILTATAATIPERDRDRALRDSRAGVNQSFLDQGMRVEPAQTMTIGGMSFEFVRAQMPGGGSSVAYTAADANRLYVLNAISRTSDAANDAELLPSILSFRLLHPVTPLPGDGPTDLSAHQGRSFLGILALLAVLVSLTYFGFRLVSRACRSRSHPEEDTDYVHEAMNRHPFRKSFICAGILWCLPLAGVLATGGNIAYRIGYTLGPCVMSALIAAVWARRSKSHWSWLRYALTVFFIWFGFFLLTAGRKLGEYAR